MGEEIRRAQDPISARRGGLDSPHITAEAKEKLTAVHQTLNPFRCKKEIEKKLRRLFNDLWTHEP
jgi:hypothetical protein